MFGIVAAPSWHYAVYAVPRGRPIREFMEPAAAAVEQAPAARHRIFATGRRSTDGFRALRPIEKKVHLHLMQISAEELCATQAHRQFLDQLLEISQLKRLQTELEDELTAAEHLTDWTSTRNSTRSESGQ